MKRRAHALRRRYGRAYPPAFAQGDARYIIYGLVPKNGGGYLKKRHLVGRGRDAYETLAELYRLHETNRGAYGQGRWTYIVVDNDAKRGKLAPIVTAEELRARKAAGG